MSTQDPASVLEYMDAFGRFLWSWNLVLLRLFRLVPLLAGVTFLWSGIVADLRINDYLSDNELVAHSTYISRVSNPVILGGALLVLGYVVQFTLPHLQTSLKTIEQRLDSLTREIDKPDPLAH